MPARKRLTGRLRAAARVAAADGGRAVVQAARDHNVSRPVVSAAFIAYAGRTFSSTCPPASAGSGCASCGLVTSSGCSTPWG
ncbi:hypothetical protein GCM10028775_47180 [Catellatospora paridis]